MKHIDIKRFLNKIKNTRPKILVLGDSMLDEYITGEVVRISPEAPVPILNFQKKNIVLGGAGNVAHNLVNIFSDVSLATIIGDDLDGEEIEKLLQKANILSDYVFKASHVNTTKKTRFLSKGSQIMRLDNDSIGFQEYDFIGLEEKIFSKISDFDSIIISDYDKGLCPKSITEKIIHKANIIGIPIFIDPKGQNWIKYQNATCITPNKKEVEVELNIKLSDDIDFEDAAKTIIKKFKLKSCLITRGSNGMTYVDREDVIHQRVSKREVFDVSGAGDTVIASFAASLSSGLTIAESLKLSSFISAEVVTHIGTTPFNIKMVN